VARAAAVTKGLAQLATDGHASWRADGVQTASRAFLSIDLPLDEVLDVARKRRVRVTDVVLCLVASAVAQASRAPNDQSLRVSTTLLVPTGSGDQGNATGAAMVVLPLGEASAIERLTATTQATKRLRSGTRALAARFVMDRLCGLLPPPLHAWFARTVYGQRFFQAIASNMPGPVQPLTFAGRRLAAAFPVLPLAPGAPVAVGALGVSGRFGLGISLHPAFVPDLAAFRTALLTTYDELRGAAEGRPIRGDADSTLSAVRRDALGGR
jgi:hypothetical protein